MAQEPQNLNNISATEAAPDAGGQQMANAQNQTANDGVDFESIDFHNDDMDLGGLGSEHGGSGLDWLKVNLIDKPMNLALVGMYGVFFGTVSTVAIYGLITPSPSLYDIIKERPQVTVNMDNVEIIERKVEDLPDLPEFNPDGLQANQSATARQEGFADGGAGSGGRGAGDAGSSGNGNRNIGNPQGERSSIQVKVPEIEAVYGQTKETVFPENDPLMEADLDMIPSPHPDLIDQSGSVLLPKIASDGRTPFEVYSKSAVIPPSMTAISVVMINLGYNARMNELALRLPDQMTLGFVPYGQNLNAWVNQAREDGHEVALHLPIQPEIYPVSDAGPNAITMDVSTTENRNRLYWALSRITGYTTILIEGAGIFHSGRNQFEPIINEINSRGLAMGVLNNDEADFVNFLTNQGSVASIFDQIIDQPLTRNSFLNKLREYELEAIDKGDLIIAVDALPNNVQRLREWASELTNRNIMLAPLSAVLERRFHQQREGSVTTMIDPKFIPKTR